MAHDCHGSMIVCEGATAEVVCEWKATRTVLRWEQYVQFYVAIRSEMYVASATDGRLVIGVM